MRNFRTLDVWILAKEIAVNIYRISSNFPKSETYGLSSQVQRAAISIPSNIAEGCSRNSNKDFIRFLEIAMGSCFELETQLIIANDIGYLDKVELESICGKIEVLQKKINAFITSVKKLSS